MKKSIYFSKLILWIFFGVLITPQTLYTRQTLKKQLRNGARNMFLKGTLGGALTAGVLCSLIEYMSKKNHSQSEVFCTTFFGTLLGDYISKQLYGKRQAKKELEAFSISTTQKESIENNLNTIYATGDFASFFAVLALYSSKHSLPMAAALASVTALSTAYGASQLNDLTETSDLDYL